MKSSYRVLLAFFLILSLALLNCSGGDDDDNPADSQGGPPPPELVYTWTFQSVTVNGTAASLDSVMEWVSNAVAARFTIGAGNQYSYEEINSAGGQLFFEIGYTIIEVNEIEVVLTLNSNGAVSESFTMTYSVTGGTLTITSIEGADTLVFTLTN